MTVGMKIKTLRKAAGMTQTELGDRLGVKKNAVSKWECGRVDDIPSSKIKAMAALFRVRPSDLIDEGDLDAIYLDDDERALIIAYREQPEMRESVRRLLKI